MKHSQTKPTPSAAHAAAIYDLQLLEQEFDDAIDFHDTHLLALEVSNQFTTHIPHGV